MIDSELISAVEKSREPAQHWFAHFEQQQRLGVWLQPPKLDMPALAEPIQKLLKARSEYKTDKFVSFGNKQVQTMAYAQFEVRRVCYIPIRALHRSQLSTN